MSKYDWSTFTKKISIHTDKEDIFKCFSSQEGLEKWFLSDAQFYTDGKEKDRNAIVSKGDTYKWMWHGSNDVAKGEILEFDNKNKLIFTFLGDVVTVEIEEEDGENMLVLTQSEINTDDKSKASNYVGCTRGWTFFMTNLKSILEGGIDLRNRNINLQNVINT